MPTARCKKFWNSGKPFGGGCQVRDCPYVHPEDRDFWASLPPYKANRRCKYFNSQGKSVGICIDGSKDCRFIHPDEPAWALADPPQAEHRPSLSRPRLISKTQGNDYAESLSVSNPRHADPSTAASESNVRSVPTSLPKLQTDMSKVTFLNRASPSRSLDFFFPEKYSDTSTSATVADSRLLLRRITGSTPVLISTPDSLNSPLASSSTISQVGGPKRQAWKNLILSLTQASNLRQEIEETDKRTSLFSVNSATALTPLDEPKLEEVLSASRDKIKGLEEKFNVIIAQFMGAEFWPFLNAVEMMARLEQSAPLDPHERLTRQLDEFEAQLKEHVKTCASMGQVIESSAMVVDDANMNEPHWRTSSDCSVVQTPNVAGITGRLDAVEREISEMEEGEIPLRNWHTPLDGSVVQNPNVPGITNRLDTVERKISEMEEGEIWRYDQIAEKVEQLFERILGAGVPSPVHANEHQNQVVSSISVEPPRDFTGARLQHLNNEFKGLCEALAEHLPIVSTLEAELGQIRLGSTDTRQSINSLESSHAKLREQLDSLSCQTLDISSQIINPRKYPQPGVGEGRDYIIRSVLQDIKQHVATAETDLKTYVVSRYKDAQKDMLVNLDSTIVKTDAIYDIMERLSEEKQLRINIQD